MIILGEKDTCSTIGDSPRPNTSEANSVNGSVVEIMDSENNFDQSLEKGDIKSVREILKTTNANKLWVYLEKLCTYSGVINIFDDDLLLDCLKRSYGSMLTLFKSSTRIFGDVDENLLKIVNVIAQNNDKSIDTHMFCYKIFTETHLYEKLINEFQLEGLALLIEGMINNFENPEESLVVTDKDYLYYDRLIRQGLVIGKIYEEGGQRRMTLDKGLSFFTRQPPYIVSYFINTMPDLFETNKILSQFKYALNAESSESPEYSDLISVIPEENIRSLLNKIVSFQSKNTKIQEYFDFLTTKNLDEIKGNCLWKGVLLLFEDNIINTTDENIMGTLVGELMDRTVFLENSARGD